LLLCSATFKKTSFQTYFNQVSVGCRHSGVNNLVQTRGEEKKRKKERKGGWGSVAHIACSRNLEIWVVKK
jgi:hypothetical protein